jgi:hypothetical protein
MHLNPVAIWSLTIAAVGGLFILLLTWGEVNQPIPQGAGVLLGPCGAMANNDLLTLDLTNLCIDGTTPAGLGLTTITVDEDGVQEVSALSRLNFGAGLDVAGSATVATVTLDTTGTWSGNAVTATTATQLASTTGCAATTFATALSDDGVLGCQNPALGTDTTGNYVESVATGAGLTGGAAGSEGAVLELALNLAGAITDGECLIWATPAIDGQACAGSQNAWYEVVGTAGTTLTADSTTYSVAFLADGSMSITGATGSPDSFTFVVLSAPSADALTANYVASVSGATGLTDVGCSGSSALACTVFIDFATVPTDAQVIAWDAVLNQPYGVDAAGAQNAVQSLFGTTGTTVTADSATYLATFTSLNGTLIITSSATGDSVDWALNAALNDLTDVTWTTPQDGQIGIWSNAGGGFVNSTMTGDATINSSGVITVSNAATADALTNDPTDCAANTVAIAIDAAANLTCVLLSDSFIPNTITIDITAQELLDDNVWVGSSGALATSEALCDDSTGLLMWDTTTNAFSCGGWTTAGDYLTATGVTLNVDPELYTWGFNSGIASVSVDDDDVIQWGLPSNATLAAFSCSTSTGTATVSMDRRLVTTPNSAGDAVFSDLPCDSDTQRTISFTFDTITSDYVWSVQIEAVSTSGVNLRVTNATGTYDD